jgi:hypothetical protein
MQSRANWSRWAETLRRFRMDGFASWLLEAAAPLTALGAQALYLGQPFFGGDKFNTFAHLLEDESESQAFARYLRAERGEEA